MKSLRKKTAIYKPRSKARDRSTPSKGTTQSTPQFQTPRLKTRMICLSLKLPSLWYFLRATLANEWTSQGSRLKSRERRGQSLVCWSVDGRRVWGPHWQNAVAEGNCGGPVRAARLANWKEGEQCFPVPLASMRPAALLFLNCQSRCQLLALRNSE